MKLRHTTKLISGQKNLAIGILIGITIASFMLAFIKSNQMTNNFKRPSTGQEEKTAEANKSANEISKANTSIQPNQTSTKTAPITTKKSISPIISPTPTPTPIPKCNESLKSAYVSSRDANIAAEDAYHQSQVGSITGYYAGHGLIDSSYLGSALGVEDSRYNAKIAQINATYQTQVASINCF
jgi:cytoskeletal protein RodZ